MSELPSNWKQVLKHCNFFLARREIANFFDFAKKKAEAEGMQAIFRNEFVKCWDRFAEHPCYENAAQFVEQDSSIFRYFQGACPGGQFYRNGFRTAKTFELGHLKLGMATCDIEELRELTREEYAFFPHPFMGGVIYHVPPVQFGGNLWGMMVGAIGGKLWNLSASIETKEQAEMVNLVRDTFKYCETFLGTPTEEQQGVQIWKMTDGNVVLQVALVTGIYAVKLFVTDGDIVTSAAQTWDYKSKFGLS